MGLDPNTLAMLRAASGKSNPKDVAAYLRSMATQVDGSGDDDDESDPRETLKKKADQIAAERNLEDHEWGKALSEARRKNPELSERVEAGYQSGQWTR